MSRLIDTLNKAAIASAVTLALPGVGDHVRIERDEKRYPSKGSWPFYRGKAGTVVEVNDGPGGPVEYGVVFRKPPAGPWRKWWNSASVAWFKGYELETGPTRSQRPLAASNTHTRINHTRKEKTHV